MADFLTQTRADLDKRLKELQPLYEECAAHYALLYEHRLQ